MNEMNVPQSKRPLPGKSGRPPAAGRRNWSLVACPPAEPRLDQVVSLWLAAGEGRRKRSTQAAYRTVADRHLLPRFGARTVSSVTREELDAFIAEKAEGTAGEPPLAPSTVCGIVTVLRAVLRFSAGLGCRTAALSDVRRPRQPVREARVLAREEQEQLEGFLYQELTPERLGVLVCLYTGLRLGEICALKWGDISADCKTLSVRRTVQRVKNLSGEGGRTTLLFDTPKSRGSARSIPLPAFLSECLLRRRRGEGCFLLTGQPERIVEPRTFQNHFKKMLRQAQVRDVNFHCLRHTFATSCVELGFDPKTLSSILGHADVSITLNTYVHPSLSRMRSFMERFDRRNTP